MLFILAKKEALTMRKVDGVRARPKFTMSLELESSSKLLFKGFNRDSRFLYQTEMIFLDGLPWARC